MSLRITAILLAVLSPPGLPAADGDPHPTSPEAERRQRWAQGVLLPDRPSSETGFVFDHPLVGVSLDLLHVFEQWSNGTFLIRPPGQLFNFAAPHGVLAADSESTVDTREFPFSPRPLRQFNYGTGIRGAAQNSGEFKNPPSVLPDRNPIVDDALLPLIIPAAATVSDAAPTIRQADAESPSGACGRCLNPADCPIDVVMAEDAAESDGGEPAPFRPAPSPQDTLFHQLISGFAGTDMPNITTTNESCSHAEPPLKAKVEHLLQAAKHLAGAGYEEEAKLFRVEAEAIQKASTRLLTEKRQELERLQREIAELEALTGQYQTIQIRCRILEFQRPTAGKACDTLHPLDAPGIHVLTGQPCSPHAKAVSGPLSADQLAAILHALEQQSCGSLKTIAEPVLVTMNGRPATLRSGGEFPILVPVAAEEGAERTAEIEWHNFGVTLQAVPFVLGNGRVRLDLETEVSDRDFSTAVNLHGTNVPGLTTARFHSAVEAQFGETVAIALNSMPKDGARRSVLVLVTAQQVEPRPEPQHHD